MPLPDRALAILRRQDALITRPQLLGLDVPRSTIDTWVTRGVLERLDREVYRRAGAPATKEQRLRAALLRGGDDARISGWSACALYGIEGLGLRRRPWIVIPPERRVRGVAFIVHARSWNVVISRWSAGCRP